MTKPTFRQRSAAVVLGALVLLAAVGQSLSPWLKTWFPNFCAPKKGGS